MSDPASSGAPVGAVIVTHGGLATELLAATERIVGPTDSIRAVSIDWDEPVEEARHLVQEAIESLDSANGILIFTETSAARILSDPSRASPEEARPYYYRYYVGRHGTGQRKTPGFCGW